MFRKSIIKKYIDLESDNVEHIITHHFSVYLILFFKTIIFLGILIVLYAMIIKYAEREYMSMMFAVIGLILFVKFCMDFLNLHLDALILTNNGIILFLWEGVLENSVEVFYWDKIETVSYKQKGLRDKLFFDGDLEILLDDGISLEFKDIHRPKKQIDRILKIKERFLLKNTETGTHRNFDSNMDSDKFNILVEALSDVVKDYVEKKDNSDYH